MRAVVLALLCTICSAQIVVRRTPIIVSAAAATPGLVNSLATGSTLTNAAGTTVNTCATRAFCANFDDPTPGATLGILSIQFSDTPSSTLAVTDDQSNTWTCLTAIDQATDAKKVAICYAPNMVAATNQVKATFSAAVTQVSLRLHQAYNIATVSPADGNNGAAGSGGSGANDITTGSFTPSQANDLIYMVGCRTQTPAATSFTPGSTQANTTWEPISFDPRDGCADQFGVQTVAGAINPQMTTTGASRYAAQAIAFKSATAGTAPSGMYVRRIQSWSTPVATSGNFNLQFPSKGNLLVASIACGGSVMVPTSITDATNTWVLTGPVNTQGPHSTAMLYAANAVANATGLITINTSGTGDCTFKLYDIMGAAAAPFTGRQINFGFETSGALTTTRIFNLVPGHTNGITLFTGQVENNTAVSFSSPATAHFDAVFYGGEGIDGPNPMDQNGPWGHLYNTSNALSTWTLTFADNSNKNNWDMEADSFMSATGSTAQYAQIVQRKQTATAATATTLAVTMTAITAGNLLACDIGWMSNAVTISKVCTNGSTCTGSDANSLTAATSNGTAACQETTANPDFHRHIYYLLSAPSGGSTAIQVNYSATTVNREATCYEVTRPSGSWAFDIAGHLDNQTGSGTTLAGPSITTTGTTGIMFAGVSVGNTIPQGGNPAVGNEFLTGGDIFATTTDATQSSVSGTAAAHQPIWTDSGASDNNCSSVAAFK